MVMYVAENSFSLNVLRVGPTKEINSVPLKKKNSNVL